MLGRIALIAGVTVRSIEAAPESVHPGPARELRGYVVPVDHGGAAALRAHASW